MGKTEIKKRKLPSIPLLHDYNDAFYYERAGYQEYYDLVKDLIVDKRHECVTVTGTPGIGKSMFYAYFFARFMRDHPEGWIVVSNF